MTRKCFFVDRIDPAEDVVTIGDKTAHHIETVLRLKPGDSIELRDGRGNAWPAVIERVGPQAVQARIAGRKRPEAESPLDVTLALAYARSDRMELALRQATEMGAHRFIAFRAERSQYGLAGGQAARRKERWEKIAREALCQCRRAILPEIHVLGGVAHFLSETASILHNDGESLKVVASEDESEESLLTLWSRFPNIKRVIGVIGPEGGWTNDEASQFVEAGFVKVRIGPRILRLETAAIALLASVQLLWGDFR